MIRLTTLGAVRVHRGETAIADLPAQRLRFALLTYLACETDVSREAVVSLFWPDRDTARGKHALRQMLYELRGVLGEDWIELHRERLVCRAAVDATAFEVAAAEGRAETALRLYAGPFLAGFGFEHGGFEGWVERRRVHLARLHRRLQREHITQLVAADRVDEALASARRWVELDPLDDEAAHTLIERLFHAGQRTAALQYFDSYEKQLAAELQVAPIDATVELVAKVRRGEQPGPRSLVVPSPAAEANAGIAPAGLADASTPPRRMWFGPGPSTVRRSVGMAIVSVALVSAGLLARQREVPPVQPQRTMRVAVLPLDDHSEDGRLSSLAAALSDQLTASLGQSKLLEVVSSRSVRLWGDEGVTTDSIGRLLSADYIVAGSVRGDDEAVSLSLELIDGRDGRLVRSAPVTRPWSESRTLVEGVVTTAATILREEVGAQLEIQRFRSTTTSEEAWQLLLQGKELRARAVALSRTMEFGAALRQLDLADSLFARSEQLDRRWSEPLVQRAGVMQSRAYTLQYFLKAEPPEVDAATRRGLEFAERAIALDEQAVGGHEIKGILLLELARREANPEAAAELTRQAESSLRRAVALEPHRQLAHRHLAQLLFDDGRYGEATLAARDAYRADPYSDRASPLLHTMFSASFEAGEDQEADSWCMLGRARFPEHAPFVWCLFALHGWGNAVPEPLKLRREIEFLPAVIRRTQPDLSDKLDAILAAAFARAGQPDSARAILSRLSNLSPAEYLWLRAAAHVQLGENDIALDLLRTFLADPHASASVLGKRQFWKLRGHPEFESLISGR